MDNFIDDLDNWTLERVNRLIVEQAREGPTLEFKRGAVLHRDQNGRNLTLTKQASGLANAGGGIVVYGIAEGDVDGVPVASALAPIADERVTADWLADVLKSNTAPPLWRFAAKAIAVPGDGNQRIIVLAVEAGHTAHQCLLDRKYYQRGATSTEPMMDHQLRDVMGRRTAPVVQANIRWLRRSTPVDVHNYDFCFELANVGELSVDRWRLEVDIPTDAFTRRDMDVLSNRLLTLQAVEVEGVRYTRTAYTPRAVESFFDDLYPGQVVELAERVSLAPLRIRVDGSNRRQLANSAAPLRWRFYLPHSRADEYSLRFEEWCLY